MKFSLGLLAAALVMVADVRAQFGPFDEPCRTNEYPPQNNPHTDASSLPWFIVDLDQPPELRWTNVTTQYADQIRQFYALLNGYLPPLVRTELVGLINKFASKLLDRAAPGDLGQEIRSIATNAQVSLGEVLLAQFSYELEPYCTSIVARQTTNSSEQVIYHARNLDSGKFVGWDAKNHTFAATDRLRAISINVDFRRQNQTVFQTTQFAGFVGVFTGVKPKVFSISVNTRHPADKRQSGLAGLIRWILNPGDTTSQFVSFYVRKVLAEATSFQDARAKLAQTPLIAPAYFTIASGETTNKTGCVLTRAPAGIVDERCIPDDSGTSNGGDWYVLQTNYDWWKSPPPWDNRRDPALRCMNQMGVQNADKAGLFNVLSTKPVRNLQTVLTALMRPDGEGSEGALIETYKRQCLEANCWPF